MANCNQCGKPAIYNIQGHPLCLECGARVQQVWYQRYIALANEYNHNIDLIEATVGLPGALPRYPTPRPVVQNAPVTFNNIKVDNSIVGSINTGEIERIDISMDHIKTMSTESAELLSAMKEFTEAIIVSKEVSDDMKNEVLEQLSFLSSQITTAKESRKRGMIKSVMGGMRDVLTSASALVVLWDKLEPLLKSFL